MPDSFDFFRLFIHPYLDKQAAVASYLRSRTGQKSAREACFVAIHSELRPPTAKKWVTRSLVSIAQSNNYQGFFEAADNLIGSKSVLRTSADECMCWFSPKLTPYQTLQLNGQISLLDGVSLKGIHASMYTYRWWLIMINLLLFNCVNLHSHPGLPETCGRLYAIEYF